MVFFVLLIVLKDIDVLVFLLKGVDLFVVGYFFGF